MPPVINRNVNPFSTWILAIRPKTLPAATAPVLVGTALAYADHQFSIAPFIACLLTALLLQVGSNLANDVFDYERGADQGERVGPLRVTQAGLLSPRQVKQGMWFVFGLTALLGIYLVWLGGWVFMVLGLAAIVSAIAYTGGPYPLGYHGLGDLFVFCFFGLVATTGTYYVQAGVVSSTAWWMSVAMGLLTVNILVVNNFRDIENDRRVGKRTLAVRFGETAAQTQYALQVLGAYAILVYLVLTGKISSWGLLPILTIPIAIYWMGYILRNKGATLNKALAGTGQLELFYACLFAVGVVLSQSLMK